MGEENAALNEEKAHTMTYNWPWGVAFGVIFGGGCLVIWRDEPFWAMALLVVGLGVGALWPKHS